MNLKDIRNRKGTLEVSAHLINEIDLEVWARIMSQLIIVRAEHHYDSMSFEYRCYSEQFREVSEGELPPRYIVSYNVADDIITFEEVK